LRLSEAARRRFNLRLFNGLQLFTSDSSLFPFPESRFVLGSYPKRGVGAFRAGAASAGEKKFPFGFSSEI
jgi:hypothetical protein